MTFPKLSDLIEDDGEIPMSSKIVMGDEEPVHIVERHINHKTGTEYESSRKLPPIILKDKN